MSGVFLFIGLTPWSSLRVIVASLFRVEVVGCHHPRVIAALRRDYCEQTSRVGFPVIHKPEFTLNFLVVDRNRIVQEHLLCLFTFDLMRPNLAEIVPIPFEHRQSNCICNASTETEPQSRQDCSSSCLRDLPSLVFHTMSPFA